MEDLGERKGRRESVNQQSFPAYVVSNKLNGKNPSCYLRGSRSLKRTALRALPRWWLPTRGGFGGGRLQQHHHSRVPPSILQFPITFTTLHTLHFLALLWCRCLFFGGTAVCFAGRLRQVPYAYSNILLYSPPLLPHRDTTF